MEAKVVRYNGVLKIDIDGKIYNPLGFKSFRPNLENVSEFYEAGVRLFCVLTSGVTSALGVPYSLYGESWVGENEYDFSSIDKQMDMFIKNAPDAYFAPMIQLDTRDWYLKLHPDKPNSFTHLSQIACDKEWKQDAANYLKAAITHIEEKYGDRTYGYFLLCGGTTEWLSQWDEEASHPIKEQGVKIWANDDNINLPTQERLNKAGGVFLSPDENDVYNARRFHSEIIADLILYFSGQAQSVIDHKKLLGVYYGYLFELGGERLYNAGSLAYEKIFLSPDIDMISSPSAYGFRGICDSSAYMLTQKTLDAHNKIYFLEFDHITHVAPEEVNDGLDENAKNRKIVKIPGAESKCKSEEESLNLMYRDFLLCNGNSFAMWWFDMFDGWFRSHKMMEAVNKMVKLTEEFSLKEVKSVAEVAVFAEGEAMYRARKSSQLATLTLSDFRKTLASCGTAYDIYSISDLKLEEIEKYKVYIFLNQYEISDKNKKLINEKLKKSGKTVLWMYAPDFAGDGEPEAEKISEITGINVKMSSSSHGKIIYNNTVSDKYIHNEPYFEADDCEASVLARFEDGSVAASYKNSDGFLSVYLAECNMQPELLRGIFELSDVFIYSNDNKVYAYPNSTSIGVYNASEKTAKIHLPHDGEYRDLISGDIYKTKEKELILPYKDINAYLLRKEK